MRRLVVTALSLSLLLGLLGCGRHVVLDPETVDRVNDRAWTVKSEPRRVEVIVTDGGAAAPPP
jgi:hypothetical protein